MTKSTANKAIITCLVVITLVMALASINPLDTSSYLLHQAGTVAFVGVMLVCYRYLHVRTMSFVLASIFIIIHIIGARYLYSYLPYDDWTQALFGINLTDKFGWQRNMYDRLVHFSYGLLLLPFMIDIFRYYLPSLSMRALLLLALQLNLATSTAYELFEWMLAMTLSPEASEAYNGQQGDIWDAHKDIMMAFLGGLSGAGIVLFNNDKDQALP
ncbi:DUF2238 domain-containing protein [Psychrobacter jeotgali]|uniref:DUF2238 domain-containing protein n=1 Tax=Psychrobacter jeotgali TaxID=179010 RepID=UPI0019187338|nr:DUF2238 domain-containing protein [Psychrobacter jeotgali]